MNLHTEALIFAAKAHDGQQRKYTGEPYITHPVAVSNTVRMAHGTDEMIAAALLHDVVEDCGVPIEVITWKFGQHIARLVCFLTDDKTITGNRAFRKDAALERLKASPASAQTIKVADLIDNTKSIVANDPKFAVTYLAEKEALLAVLERANPTLRREATAQVQRAIRSLALS